jgi:predicted Zn-ribbon and HTH transcriptional regulator
MKRWNEWLYPELKHLPRRSDRQSAMLAMQPRIYKSPGVWLTFVVAVAFGVALPKLIDLLYRQLPAAVRIGSPIVMAMISGAIQGLTFAFALVYGFRRMVRRFLREYLNEQGFHLCLVCGYDLRGQTTPRCPECGTAFDASRICDQADASD